MYHLKVHDEYFVVCVLQVSCSRLIQPVEVYTNWYMMWYLKTICSARNISFQLMNLFNTVCPSFIFFWSVWPSSVIQRTHSTWNWFMNSACAFVCMLVLMIVCMILWAIVCPIVCKIFLLGPGFEPLTSLYDLFSRSRVQTPDLTAWPF